METALRISTLLICCPVGVGTISTWYIQPKYNEAFFWQLQVITLLHLLVFDWLHHMYTRRETCWHDEYVSSNSDYTWLKTPVCNPPYCRPKVVNTCVSGTANICCEMLVSTLSVVRSLPPLSLANENHISGLGFETLSQVGGFLKQMAVPSSGADVKGEFDILLWIFYIFKPLFRSNLLMTANKLFTHSINFI